MLDAGGVPIPEPRKYNSPDGEAATTQPHRVLIASEEQFKLFVLPTLKPSGKYKLTAHEGARVRRVGFVTFAQKSKPEYTENCFTCLTNQGDLAIHSLPELRRQVLQVNRNFIDSMLLYNVKQIEVRFRLIVNYVLDRMHEERRPNRHFVSGVHPKRRSILSVLFFRAPASLCGSSISSAIEGQIKIRSRC